MAEVAAIVSAALENSHITATLSGGAAVTIYSDNAYESSDLDFVTSESNQVIKATIAKLGFQQSGSSRMFEHLNGEWYVEFPPGPLGFGDTYIDARKRHWTRHRNVATPQPGVASNAAECFVRSTKGSSKDV